MPTCGILRCPPAVEDVAKAIAADDGAGLHDDAAAEPDAFAQHDPGMEHRRPRRPRPPRPTKTSGRHRDCAAPITAPAPITAIAPIDALGSIRASAATIADESMPGGRRRTG